MTKNMYWLWKSVLPKEFCEYVLKNIDWTKSEQGVVGATEGKINKKIRKSNVVWQDQFSIIGCVAQSYVMAANRYAEWNYDISFFERIQQTKYDKTDHYTWHKDSFAPNEMNQQRKLTISILLNDPKEFEGGKFQFKDLENEDNLLTEQGSIIVFPSFYEHRVTPVTKGIRNSAVTWGVGTAFR